MQAPVIVESLDQEGRGVAHVDGKTIFIDGALPTEKVTYQITRNKSTYAFANVAEILKQSNLRVTPKCSHYGLCGGCKLQHLDFAGQVASKQRLLENDLKHIGKVKPENMLPPLYGPTWGYRHKARLSVKFVTKKDRVLVGFNEKGTRYVADMNSCEVLTPAVSALIEPLQIMIAQLSLRDKIPQLELAVGEDKVIVLIFRIMDALQANDEGILKAFANRHKVHIWTQTKGPETVKPFYPDRADLQYSLPEFTLTYPFKPNEFTQVNPQINQMMVRRAMQLLNPQAGERIADFFCGIGNFTLPIARSGASVLGLEGLKNLVERAKESASLNKLEAHAQFGVSDLFQMTTVALTGLGKFDKWLIDPPRDGAFELVKAISEENAPQKIVYVSCNPATLARDADVLVNEKGYQLSAAGVINMFPHTTHVESIACFVKN
ncbi:MAG: 23S rRNA (uracil(1939)-C(5))-methyltransferase RlmD [Methylophilaceae bacterium]